MERKYQLLDPRGPSAYGPWGSPARRRYFRVRRAMRGRRRRRSEPYIRAGLRYPAGALVAARPRRVYRLPRTPQFRQKPPIPRHLSPKEIAATIKFTKEEEEYINTVINPFGMTPGGGMGHHCGGRIMDPSSGPSSYVQTTVTYQIDGAAGGGATSGAVKLLFPNSSNDDGLSITYSAGGGAGTGQVQKAWEQMPAVKGLSSRWRLVSMGLKVNVISAEDNNVGTIQGGISTLKPVYGGGPTWPNYSTLTAELEPLRVSAQRGMTVRWYPQGNKDFEYNKFEAAGTLGDNADWRAPMIVWESLGATTVLEFVGVAHFEVQVQATASPWVATPSPVSMQWPLLVAMVSHPDFAPFLADGQSFKSFFSKLFNIIPRAVNWVVKHAPAITSLAGGIAALL